jgi:hypothetical protein
MTAITAAMHAAFEGSHDAGVRGLNGMTMLNPILRQSFENRG